MKKKVCPYCDQVMKGPAYCGFCHRLVFHPEEREVNYYLNERHPAVEENCSYHGTVSAESGEETHVSRGSETMHLAKRLESRAGHKTSVREADFEAVPSAVSKHRSKMEHSQPPKVFSGREGGAISRQGLPAAGAKKKYGNVKKKRFNPISAVILVYMVAMAVTALVKNFAGFENRAETAFVQQPALQNVAQGTDDRERTAGQDIAEGKACTAFEHLDMDAETAIPAFKKKIEEAGYSVEEFYQSSMNIVQDDYRSYNTYYNFDLLKDESWKGGLELFFDTATGKMHGIQLDMDREETGGMTVGALEAMKALGLLDEKTDGEALLESMMEEATEDTIGHVVQDGLEIELMLYEVEEETRYSLTIYGNGYNTDLAEEV